MKKASTCGGDLCFKLNGISGVIICTISKMFGRKIQDKFTKHTQIFQKMNKINLYQISQNSTCDSWQTTR